MNTLGKIAFYVLFAFGAVRLFNGMMLLWPLLYGTSGKAPDVQEGVSRRYYRFDNLDSIESKPMDANQVIILIVTGLLLIGLAFYIRKKVDDKTFGETN